ncbi:hypothetical protein POX_f08189 [Penicillium oxalicum]|uniref:hypothetical protein n=1 Tax=Penicillium oxalicum TaxID=69781 RepID=UPI0020B881E4|nr:hypothetical protein POX_f08189 [Penicillium oxalicum]KAI2787812.1 hypothetical protein POX_f08189 [Penicillium oxalicum]
MTVGGPIRHESAERVRAMKSGIDNEPRGSYENFRLGTTQWQFPSGPQAERELGPSSRLRTAPDRVPETTPASFAQVRVAIGKKKEQKQNENGKVADLPFGEYGWVEFEQEGAINPSVPGDAKLDDGDGEKFGVDHVDKDECASSDWRE